MDLEVFDTDPERLVWINNRKIRSVIGLYQPGKGFVKEALYSGGVPPTDECYEGLLNIAKALSRESHDADSSVSTFVMLRLIRTGRSEQTRPMAEYYNGKLEAYCRPPWRKGQGL